MLMQAKIEILPNDNCPFGKNFNSDKQICAGTSDFKIDICGGDSGGPLMKQLGSVGSQQRYWYSFGIVNYGPKNPSCGEHTYAASVYVRLAAYRQWINEKLKISYLNI
ncbi:unnamed protein product [Didymodactylos carnosus]|nr:unnamed protein product [Didymodactylos carnosus]CAF3979592.1 unnamed protein product [Didymodactylos carnosus]